MGLADWAPVFDFGLNLYDVINRHDARSDQTDAIRREERRIDALNQQRYEDYEAWRKRQHENYLNYVGMFQAAQAAKIAAKNRGADTMLGGIPMMKRWIRPNLRSNRRITRAGTKAYLGGLKMLESMANAYFTPENIAKSQVPSSSFATQYDPLINPRPEKED